MYICCRRGDVENVWTAVTHKGREIVRRKVVRQRSQAHAYGYVPRMFVNIFARSEAQWFSLALICPTVLLPRPRVSKPAFTTSKWVRSERQR